LNNFINIINYYETVILREEKIMKTKITILIVSIILSSSIITIVGGQTDSKSFIDLQNNDSEQQANTYVSRIWMIGRIRDLIIDEEIESENYTGFTAIRVFAIHIYRYNIISRGIEVGHYRNTPVYFPTEYYEFRGILRNRFVCGFFQYIH